MGIVSDEEEINEIENIVKAFFVEERMIDITYHIEKKDIIKKTELKLFKKLNIRRNLINEHIPFLTVRGLN